MSGGHLRDGDDAELLFLDSPAEGFVRNGAVHSDNCTLRLERDIGRDAGNGLKRVLHAGNAVRAVEAVRWQEERKMLKRCGLLFRT